MTVTLELTLEEVAVLRTRAEASGVDIETVLHSLVAQAASSPAPQVQELALTEKKKGAIALMQSWPGGEQADDPEEQAEREREQQEFAANINRWRAEQGLPAAF